MGKDAGEAEPPPAGAVRQYFEEEPASSSDRRTVRLALPDVTLDLVTDAGVFSRDGVDPGSKLLLLEAPEPAQAGDVLDLGCGYGAMALTMAARAPGATVWAVDVNRRAVELAAENARTNGFENVRAVTPDAVPDGVRFGTIWSNPPIRIGKPALHDLLREWLPRLDARGDSISSGRPAESISSGRPAESISSGRPAEAVLVVQKHLGSDSLAAWLTQEGWAVDRLTSKMGYRILSVTR